MSKEHSTTPFYFSLSFINEDGDSLATFTEVSGISSKKAESSIDPNLAPATPNHENLVLKRGVIMFDTPLFHWCSGTLTGGLGEPVKPRNIYISLLDEYANVLKTWKAMNAWPVRISITESDSEQEIIVENLEIAYTSLESE